MGFSWKGAVNKIGDGGEKLIGKAKKKAGEIIDDGAHIVGDGLDHVGLDDAADWVEDKGDHIADHLGAHVAEQQLGQSDEPGELLHGDPDKIRAAVLHLAKLSLAFDSGHTGLSHLDPGDWDGFGADAFRAKFKAQPAKWAHAATACAEAGLALEAYAETVDWAKGQAKEAVRLWKQGVAARKAAADAYNSAVDTYHDDVKAYNDKVDDGKDPGTKPVAPAAFTDPGAKDKQAAKDTLDAARKQRDSAASTAEAKVREATKLAPAKPDFTDRMKHDGSDVGKALPIAGEHFVGGLVRSGTDLVKFARGLNPYDPYNLTHPAQYLTHLNATAAGLVDMTQHPERLPGTILGTGWGSDGSEASGRLVGNILLAIATDGGSAAGRTVAEDAAKNAAKDAAEQAARSGARGAAEDPAKAAIEKAAKKCLSDPIDVATGDMILTQTDITLPGTLPLVLERTHLSSYRTGRYFGPSWASTLDQRLELDDQGVAFVTDDGSILLYPVPEPGVPALPSHGPRWPLEWDGHPGSPLRITNTETGRTLHFAAVPGVLPLAGVSMLLPLTEISDRNGNNWTITYDEAGVPAAIHHSGGYHLTLGSHEGRVTALRLLDPAAPDDTPGTVVRAYAYDDAGNLVAVTDSSGLPYQFGYDTAARITSWTDRTGTTYGYAYDAQSRCVATHGEGGYLSGTFAYDDATRTTTFTDSLGQSSTYTHSTAYRLLAETDPLGHTTTQEWDEADRHLTAVTDPLGHTTRYAYDDAGNVTEVTLPDGTSATATYDDFHQPLHVTEPGGADWTHVYDDAGNLLTTIDPLGAATRYAYDGAGRPTAITNALRHTRLVTCNAAGLPISLTDELGHTTEVRRELFGRVVEVIDPLGHSSRLGWTTEGRPSWRELADGTCESWAWDPEGNLLSHTDLAGNTTHHTVGHFGVPVTRTDPDGAHYAFAYDTELRLTTVTNPQGLPWSHTYDAAGRLVAETDFDGRTLTYTRDGAGRVAARTNAVGQTLRFVRDSLGRVVEQHADGGAVTTFAYAPDGSMCRAVNGDADVSLDRDVLGRVLSETVNGRTTTSLRDAVGRRTRRVTPSGLVSEWTYDAAGHPLALRSSVGGALDFVHDAAGRETHRALNGQATLDQTWTATGLLNAQVLIAAPGNLLQHRAFDHRPDGHLTEIRELTSGTRRFDLDGVGRVVRARAHGWNETYKYDGAGNLVHAASPAHEAPGERRFDGTLVRSAGRTFYTHDAEGRLVRRTRKLLNGQTRTWTYSWNAESRLTEVVTPARDRWRYAYDPLGRRVSKMRLAGDGSVVDRTEFAWDDLRLAEQTAANGQVTTWDHAPDSSRPVAQTSRVPARSLADTSPLAKPADETDVERRPRIHTVVTDAVGTPTELVSATGELVWQRRAGLWGTDVPAPEEASASADCPLRFPGQYADPETGLCYNLHRYYDPETARYISADPLGLVPSPNHHAYVPNPLSWSDDLGLAGKGPTGPRNPLDFGQGYTGRADIFPVGNKGMDVEIHVYNKSMREVGLYNSQGWFNKHGIKASEVEVPPDVENAIKGRMIDELRKVGRIGPKGTEDITGDKWRRPPLAAEGCK